MRLLKKMFNVALAIICFVSFSGFEALSAVVRLRNGKEIHGTIIKQDDRMLYMQKDENTRADIDKRLIISIDGEDFTALEPMDKKEEKPEGKYAFQKPMAKPKKSASQINKLLVGLLLVGGGATLAATAKETKTREVVQSRQVDVTKVDLQSDVYAPVMTLIEENISGGSVISWSIQGLQKYRVTNKGNVNVRLNKVNFDYSKIGLSVSGEDYDMPNVEIGPGEIAVKVHSLDPVTAPGYVSTLDFSKTIVTYEYDILNRAYENQAFLETENYTVVNRTQQYAGYALAGVGCIFVVSYLMNPRGKTILKAKMDSFEITPVVSNRYQGLAMNYVF